MWPSIFLWITTSNTIDLGRLTGQTGHRGQGAAQQTGGVTTPLLAATVRLLGESASKGKGRG